MYCKDVDLVFHVGCSLPAFPISGHASLHCRWALWGEYSPAAFHHHFQGLGPFCFGRYHTAHEYHHTCTYEYSVHTFPCLRSRMEKEAKQWGFSIDHQHSKTDVWVHIRCCPNIFFEPSKSWNHQKPKPQTPRFSDGGRLPELNPTVNNIIYRIHFKIFKSWTHLPATYSMILGIIRAPSSSGKNQLLTALPEKKAQKETRLGHRKEEIPRETPSDLAYNWMFQWCL